MTPWDLVMWVFAGLFLFVGIIIVVVIGLAAYASMVEQFRAEKKDKSNE